MQGKVILGVLIVGDFLLDATYLVKALTGHIIFLKTGIILDDQKSYRPILVGRRRRSANWKMWKRIIFLNLDLSPGSVTPKRIFP